MIPILSSLLLLLAATDPGGPSTGPSTAPGGRSIVKINPAYHGKFEIVREQVPADGSAATLVVRGEDGIFSFDFDLAGTRFDRLTLVIKEPRGSEGISFQPVRGRGTELREAKGVTVTAAGKDVVIEFGPEGVQLLRPGGRFQFIDFYR